MSPQAPLTALLADLETAIRNADSPLAWQLAQTILHQLAEQVAQCAHIELQVKAMLAAMDSAKPTAIPFLEHQQSVTLDDVFAEKSAQHADAAAAAQQHGCVYPVWFATNRNPNANGEGFGNERARQVSRGRVLVHIPESHRFGETGSGFWQRLRRFDLRDDHLRLQEIEAREGEAFFAEIRASMQEARDSGSAPQGLIFIHGYNVSFEDAAIRTAQIGYDLKIPGAAAFFSWPSRGTLAAYTADEASIEASEQVITDFLIEFASQCGAEKLHIIAHSMGNRGLLRALQRIAANAQGQIKFGQIFLAAPDVDRDLFLDLAELYPQHAERTTLYASAADKAVYLSSNLHAAPRAGYFEPYTIAHGIDTVVVPDFNVDMLGHSYFAKAEALLHDMFDLINHGQAPERRQRIKPKEHEGERFWQVVQ